MINFCVSLTSLPSRIDNMDETIKSIRRKAYGTSKQPNEIDGSKALRSGLRSIA